MASERDATAQGAAAQLSEEPELPPFRFSERPFSVNVMLGLGTPVGEIGGMLEYTAFDRVAFGAGAGTDPDDGLQVAALTRLRALTWERPRRAFALAVSVAAATGRASSRDQFPTFDIGEGNGSTTYSLLDHALWLQPDLEFEYAVRSGFHLVAGVGAAYLLNPGSQYCRDLQTDARAACDSPSVASALPTFTVELGYSLP